MSRASTLAALENPSQADYRRFHLMMAKQGSQVETTNKMFKEKYDELMTLRSKKGSTVNKRGPLQELVKMWGMASSLHKGPTADVFQSGLLCRDSWQKQEDIVSEKDTIGWVALTIISSLLVYWIWMCMSCE